MKCFNCRSQISSDQQFCRVCGAELSEDSRTVNPVVWGLLAAFIGIVIALTGKMLDLRMIVFAGVIVSIAGMFFIAAFPLMSRKRKHSFSVKSEPDFLAPAKTTNKLPPMSAIDQMHSVTDNTTILLKAPEKKT